MRRKHRTGRTNGLYSGGTQSPEWVRICLLTGWVGMSCVIGARRHRDVAENVVYVGRPRQPVDDCFAQTILALALLPHRESTLLFS